MPNLLTWLGLQKHRVASMETLAAFFNTQASSLSRRLTSAYARTRRAPEQTASTETQALHVAIRRCRQDTFSALGADMLIHAARCLTHTQAALHRGPQWPTHCSFALTRLYHQMMTSPAVTSPPFFRDQDSGQVEIVFAERLAHLDWTEPAPSLDEMFAVSWHSFYSALPQNAEAGTWDEQQVHAAFRLWIGHYVEVAKRRVRWDFVAADLCSNGSSLPGRAAQSPCPFSDDLAPDGGERGPHP